MFFYLFNISFLCPWARKSLSLVGCIIAPTALCGRFTADIFCRFLWIRLNHFWTYPGWPCGGSRGPPYAWCSLNFFGALKGMALKWLCLGAPASPWVPKKKTVWVGSADTPPLGLLKESCFGCIAWIQLSRRMEDEYALAILQEDGCPSTESLSHC